MINELKTPFGIFKIKVNGVSVNFKLEVKEIEYNGKKHNVNHIEYDVSKLKVDDKIICEVEKCNLEYNDSDEWVELLTIENSTLIMGVAGIDPIYHGFENQLYSFELDSTKKNFEYTIYRNPKEFKRNIITLDVTWINKSEYEDYDTEIFMILC